MEADEGEMIPESSPFDMNPSTTSSPTTALLATFA
jgi:hypothetical protein